MKKKFMKKALAVVLSTAMTFTLSSTGQLQNASAAKKFVGLNTSFKTLKVGQTYKLRLVNNTSSWKIKKVATTDKSIATVYGKKSSSVMIKGKGTGRATIRVSVKTAARKANNTKTLRCRVNVKGTDITPTPAPSKDPVKTSVEVTTQAELNDALANNAITSITVTTSNAASLTIPAGKYGNVDLTVNAPNVDIVNNAVFKSITIKAIKGDTWTENAQGNKITVDALKARIVVNEAANISAITITKAKADVALVVNGTAAGVTVNAKAKLNITGTTKGKVPVTVSAAAADTEIISAVAADIQLHANAVIELLKGAEESAVQVLSAAATVTVKNNTDKKITVTDAKNAKTDVKSKGTHTVKPSATTGSTGTSTGTWGGGSSWIGSGGSSSSGSSTKRETVVRSHKELADALKVSTMEKITIMDNADGTGNELKIDEGNYSAITLVVNAPKSTIENHANFKEVQIKNIAPDTWMEYAENILTVEAPTPHIFIAEKAKVKSLIFKGAVKKAVLDVKGTISSAIRCQAANADAKVTLNVEGSVQGVQVVSAMTVVVSAPAGVTLGRIPVTISAPKALLYAMAPVAVKVEVKEVAVTLEAGAENSTLEMADKDLKPYVDTKVDVPVTVTNDSSVKDVVIEKEQAAGEVIITDEGKVEVDTEAKPPVEAGDNIDEDAKDEIKDPEPLPDNPSTDDEPGTDEPGTDEPGTDEPGTDEPGTDDPENPAATPTATVSVTSGSSLVISASAITVNGTAEEITSRGNAKFGASESAAAGSVSYGTNGYEFTSSDINGANSFYVEFTATTASGTYTLKVTVNLSELTNGVAKTINATVVSSDAT